MLDLVNTLQAEGFPLEKALAPSGRRRQRPVRMTTVAAAPGMLPLAWEIGLLSLVATPTLYLLLRHRGAERS